MGEEPLDFHEELKQLLVDRQFRRFTIVMSSGTRYEVRMNLQCGMYRSMMAYYPESGGVAFFPVHHVSSIEVIEED